MKYWEIIVKWSWKQSCKYESPIGFQNNSNWHCCWVNRSQKYVNQVPAKGFTHSKIIFKLIFFSNFLQLLLTTGCIGIDELHKQLWHLFQRHRRRLAGPARARYELLPQSVQLEGIHWSGHFDGAGAALDTQLTEGTNFDCTLYFLYNLLHYDVQLEEIIRGTQRWLQEENERSSLDTLPENWNWVCCTFCVLWLGGSGCVSNRDL